MNKLHRSRYINVVVSMMMAFLMLAAMGTTQVHAAQYTTGTIDPAELKAGDVVYRGVQLTVDRQIVVCKVFRNPYGLLPTDFIQSCIRL